jgi:sulfur-carrier protein adenylyltransferase/sulfurtransferase
MAKENFNGLLAKVKSEISEVNLDEVQSKLDDASVSIIDVREADEWDGGIVPGAITLPRGFLELQIEGKISDKEKEIIVYCAGGVRSALAAKSLQDLGYKNVHSLIGGFNAWKRAEKPFDMKKGLSKQQAARYLRHTMLPEVEEVGQLKLLEAKVLLIGAGGLGSPAGLYLAAAGVGTLGFVDFDVVDLSNLQRQILHTEDRVGTPKTESAKKTIAGINSDVTVVEHREKITRDNAFKILKDYDVVVNGCDNFPTRYLLNDACVLSNKPMVDGSIFRFEGQVTVFDPPKGPCYRCLYPEPPPPDMAPSCAEAGVIGVLPGIIGSLQALETIKLILGIGEPLVNRLLMYDALKQQFRELKIRRDPACPVCGEAPTITELIDYEWFCSAERPQT